VARHHDRGEEFGRKAHFLQQTRFDALRAGIQQLRGRGDGVFGDHLPGEQIRQGVGHEEQPLGGGQLRRTVALHGVELVERIELHDLDARRAVDLLPGQHLGEILLGGAVGVRVAVGVGESQQRAVLADEGEIDAPGVDADRGDFDPFAGGGAQSLAKVFVERKDIPVIMSAQRQDGIRETGQFLEDELSVPERAENGAAAGGPQVEGDEVFGLHVSVCDFWVVQNNSFFRRFNVVI
jgi:hypothetical protein